MSFGSNEPLTMDEDNESTKKHEITRILMLSHLSPLFLLVTRNKFTHNQPEIHPATFLDRALSLHPHGASFIRHVRNWSFSLIKSRTKLEPARQYSGPTKRHFTVSIHHIEKI